MFFKAIKFFLQKMFISRNRKKANEREEIQSPLFENIIVLNNLAA